MLSQADVRQHNVRMLNLSVAIIVEEYINKNKTLRDLISLNGQRSES